MTRRLSAMTPLLFLTTLMIFNQGQAESTSRSQFTPSLVNWFSLPGLSRHDDGLMLETSGQGDTQWQSYGDGIFKAKGKLTPQVFLGLAEGSSDGQSVDTAESNPGVSQEKLSKLSRASDAANSMAVQPKDDRSQSPGKASEKGLRTSPRKRPAAEKPSIPSHFKSRSLNKRSTHESSQLNVWDDEAILPISKTEITLDDDQENATEKAETDSPECPVPLRSCEGECGAEAGRIMGCSCDSQCLVYGDCCEDVASACPAVYDEALQAYDKIDDALPDCDRPSQPLLLKSCLKGHDPQVVERCQEQPSGAFLQDVFPVSVANATASFLNVHCAVCNNVSVDSLRPWRGVLLCQNASRMAVPFVSMATDPQCSFRWEQAEQARLCHPVPVESQGNDWNSTHTGPTISSNFSQSVPPADVRKTASSDVVRNEGVTSIAQCPMQDEEGLPDLRHCYPSSSPPCSLPALTPTPFRYSVSMDSVSPTVVVELDKASQLEEDEAGWDAVLPTQFVCRSEGGQCEVTRCQGPGSFAWGQSCETQPISVLTQVATWYEEKKDPREEGLQAISPKIAAATRQLGDSILHNLSASNLTSSCRTAADNLRTLNEPVVNWVWSGSLVCGVKTDVDPPTTRSAYVDMVQGTLLDTIMAVQQDVKLPMDMNVTLCLMRNQEVFASNCFVLRQPLNGTRLAAMQKANITVEAYISLACCVASDVGLLARIVLQYFVPFFNTYPGKVQFCLCCSLLFAYTSFLAGGIVEEGSGACRAVAVTTHWGFLCALFWMNVTAYQIWHTFRHWSHQVVSKGKSSLVIFCLYTIFIPLSIVGAALLVEELLGESPFSPRYGFGVCWITKPYAVITYFMVPCGIICVANAFLVGMTLRGLKKQRKNVRDVQRSGRVATVSDITITVKIILLVGVTWFIGIIAAIFETQVLWMMFSVVNASLGLVIAMVLLCNQRVFNLLKTKLRCVKSEHTTTITIDVPNHI